MGDPKQRKGLSSRHSPESRVAFSRIANSRFGEQSGYWLARDECGEEYAGPDWAPYHLWESAEYGDDDLSACAKVLCYGTGAEALWADIAKKCPRPDSVAFSLPRRCANARARWADIPRMTPSGWREHRERLARNAEQLATELERFYLHRDPDEYELPGLMDFAELMTQEELDRFDQAIRMTGWRIASAAMWRAGMQHQTWDQYNDIGDQARSLGYARADLFTPAGEDARNIYGLMLRDHSGRHEHEYGGVPPLPDMLRRIAHRFAQDGQDAPIARPNLPNAERNFFARALCKYFWQSFGDVSPSIVRDVVCMFFPQGIDENEVSQMAARVKAAYPRVA